MVDSDKLILWLLQNVGSDSSKILKCDLINALESQGIKYDKDKKQLVRIADKKKSEKVAPKFRAGDVIQGNEKFKYNKFRIRAVNEFLKIYDCRYVPEGYPTEIDFEEQDNFVLCFRENEC